MYIYAAIHASDFIVWLVVAANVVVDNCYAYHDYAADAFILPFAIVLAVVDRAAVVTVAEIARPRKLAQPKRKDSKEKHSQRIDSKPPPHQLLLSQPLLIHDSVLGVPLHGVRILSRTSRLL
ncbi:hypothetical protein TI39_contig491g00005 [Zymoseptoria brevis]|uniref:Uncharacterized protein n=1 Tax=Zymoseptoria brevis TaxID=1047168 RepID=A0A0F4GJ51_9PEZI|nr:hypothetical protein TI39_contig491g00005 [Zymoseptoria brevis]